ncbi:MAG: restriction endonuclease subunit S [Acidobacteria bacterium]|nr:restriction endonuclease subunit S [Acidobacteriota bacterium]
MNEWVTTKLKAAPLEIIDGDRGVNYPRQDEFSRDGHCLFLSAQNVKETGFSFSECQFISPEKDAALRKGKLKRCDTVLTTRGTVGNLGYYSEAVPYENVRINSGMVIIRPDLQRLDSKFCYYLFRSLQKREFGQFATGSAQPQLPIRDLNEIEVRIPLLDEQRAIAEVLSSLDDKIDLLHHQNKTLERLAETLFRQWFIEEADPSWKEGTLADLSENIRENVHQSNISSGTKYIGLEHIERKHFALYSAGVSDGLGSNKSIFKRHDILFGKLRPYFHKVCFAPFDGVCSTDILVIRPKDDIYFPFCLLAYFQKEVVDHSDMASEGTRMPRTNWQILGSYPIVVPNRATLEKFNALIAPSILKVEQNLQQIKGLTATRDALLPKLMSGEAHVN